MKALDPYFKHKVQDSFERQGFMKHLGATLNTVEAGICDIEVPFRPELAQQHGYFHAGVTGAVLDTASGYAAFSLMPEGTSVLTVEYKMNLVAPADGSRLIARAQVIKNGKTLKICEARAFAVKDGEEKLCAVSLSTIMVMKGKSDQASKDLRA